MNIFLKVGIFLMCEPEISDNTASNDLESDEISEENPIIDEFALKKWGTRQGVIDVALGGNNHSEKSDRERWGTREGIIEVAGEEFVDERTPLERWGTREGVMEIDFGQEREQKYLKRILKLRKLQFQAESARNKRLRRHDVIQIVINNTSDKERGITFWGNGIPVSPPLAEDIEDHQVISKTPVGVHPQGVIVNPFNAFIYVANQLSDSVSITRIDGVLIKTVHLLQVGYPGTYSPTHLAVHSKAESSGYGKVYVAGSVANSVSVIGTNNEVTKVIRVGIRPVGIAFNPVNERIYVANLVSNTISVISTTTDEVIETLPAQPGPWQLSINTVNGDIYILYRRTGKIQIWNVSHTLVFESNAIAEPVSLAWNPEANRMYVVSIANDQINAIEADTHILLAPVPTGHRPYAIAFHPGNKFIYVANTEDGTISIVDSANTLRGTIPSNGINTGLAIHSQNFVAWSNTGSQLVEAAGFAQETSAIQTDYNRLSDDQNYFHYNPATLEHIRFVVSGERSVKKLTVTHATISGKKTDTAISLTNYESPQHFSKVYEIDTIKGTILDGNSRWRFTMPPLQTVTLLIYYRPTSRELFFKKSLNNGVKQKIC